MNIGDSIEKREMLIGCIVEKREITMMMSEKKS
jgi:hypothetical protein